MTTAPHHVWGRSDLIIVHSSYRGLLIVSTACTRSMKPRFKELGRHKRIRFHIPLHVLSHGDHESGECLPRRLLSLIGKSAIPPRAECICFLKVGIFLLEFWSKLRGF
ncbi:hypothetical protein CEXT_335301 [Caerostris extrusa]|uniref:Uncharacterized protein n=1 Tax=Caerostris extrusa TaxID=172846 RepID=A0AAV4NPX1_CAEEX|nr:hypothetical protein CEXT_335301 [Caerostris extrusa]